MTIAIKTPRPHVVDVHARLQAERAKSRDPRRQVAAVIISADGQFLGAGHNRFGAEACETPERWESPAKHPWLIHAEEDAIHDAYEHGAWWAMRGATIYCTYHPCDRCANHIVRAGIKRLVCPSVDLRDDTWGEKWRTALAILEGGGVIWSPLGEVRP